MKTCTAVNLALELILLNVLPENYINVFNDRDRLDCTEQCMYDVSCLAVVYHTESDFCYLYNQIVWTEATGVTDPKFMLYKTDRSNLTGEGEGKAKRPCFTGVGYVRVEVLDFCYKMHSKRLANPAADAVCKSEGGTGLAKLDTLDKVNLFMGIIPVDRYTHVNGYLAGSDWVYPAETNPDTTPYLQWKPGQPNGANINQDCLAVDANGIHDAFCDLEAQFPFICEM